MASNGDDVAGLGTLTSPYKTIATAKLAVRSYLLNFNLGCDVNVIIRGGEYFLGQTLEFASSDSGENGHKIIYKPYNGEIVKVSGGMLVGSPWSNDSKPGVKKILLNNSIVTELRQLYINEIPATRARRGLNISNPTNSGANTYINVPTGSPIPTNQSDIELVTTWKWFNDRLKVQSLSATTITVSNDFGVSNHEYLSRLEWMENAYEFLDSPNEWFYNKHTGYLYYYPPSNVTMTTARVIAPLLQHLIAATDLKDVVFENLIFKDATWLEPNIKGYHPKQASVYYTNPSSWSSSVPGNLKFTNCSNVTVRNCEIKNCGGEGIAVDGANTENIVITENEIHNISSSGIRVGREVASWTSITEVSGVEITNNKIHDVAREFFSSVGIFLMMVSDIDIVNNEIYNLPYSGISTGYSWTNNEVTPLGNITIQSNDIHHVLTMLSDGGAIYNLGFHNSPSIISNNYIHNIPSHSSIPAPRVPIYLDQASENITVTNNYGFEISSYQGSNAHIFRNTSLCNENIVEQNSFGCNSHWLRMPHYLTEVPYAQNCCNNDLGIRFIDVNNDGFKDLIMHRWISASNTQVRSYLNTGTGWLRDDTYVPPYHLAADPYGDMGVLFLDFDGDGLEDMIYRRKGYEATQNKAFRNTGCGWEYIPSYNPPVALFDDAYGELGIRAVDVDHNGLKDLIYFRWLSPSVQEKGVWLNNGSGWVQSSNPSYTLPYHINSASCKDLGVRFVDLNDDGYEDLVYNRLTYQQAGAFMNTGNGWQVNGNYTPPEPIASDALGDLGARFIDVDHDGKKDLVYYRIKADAQVVKKVYLNQNGTWTLSANCSHNLPIPISKDGSSDLGVRVVDLNGDGYDDLLKGYFISANDIQMDAYLNDSWHHACDASSECFQGNLGGRAQTYAGVPGISNTSLEDQVSIYPNPTKGLIYLKNMILGSKCSIYNSNGMLMRTDFVNSEKTIDISILPSGLYLLVITAKGKEVYFKMMKE